MTIPLVGREAEFARLRRLQEELPSGPGGRLVVVSGEPGVGKTRLLSEAFDQQASLKLSFPRGRFAVPGLGIARLAQTELDGADVLRSRLHAPDQSGSGRVAIWLAADDVVRRAAPCVFVLDDLQWADELTLGWVAQLGALLETTPVLLAAGIRAVGRMPLAIWEALQDVFRRDRGEEIRLAPLQVDGVAQLSAAMGHPKTRAFASRLHQRTDGVPLAVIELLRRATRDGGRPKAAFLDRLESIGELPLLSAVVHDQLMEAGDDGRALLAVAALLPHPPAEDRVRRVLHWDPPRYDRALARALDAGLIANESGVLVFRHELQRQAIQDQLTVEEARPLHRSIADVLRNEESPAGQVAQHLLDAGERSDAATWFEHAAEEAEAVHDHGNALRHLGAALEVTNDQAAILRLADRVVQTARASGEIDRGLRLLAEATSRISAPLAEGRLLLSRARLVAYRGDHASRLKDLLAARETFRHARDDLGTALAMGELALPVGGTLKLRERVAFGRKGLELAEASGDRSAIALCAGNLAAAEIMSGNRAAFELWERAISALQPSSTVPLAPEAFRNATNWATGALAFGDYATAGRVIERHLAPTTDPAAASTLGVHRALLSWRTGDWDAALAHASAALDAHRPEHAALASLLVAAVGFEREAHPDLSRLVEAVSVLVEVTEEDWGPLGLAILVDARAARREPQPSRGVLGLVERVVRSATVVGWDDLLPVTARVDPALCKRILLMIGERTPRGPRGEASLRMAAGLLADAESKLDAETELMEAADGFEALPEPYAHARAIEACAAIRLRQGKRVGELRRKAAEIYSSLGAHRSLASLLRRSGGSRALSGFTVPSTHARRPSPGLTPREKEVADLARLGHPARAIAATLGLSTATVQKHLERVKAKLGVERKSDLVRLLASE